uniref:Gamma-tubulin complex component n=1 Tax=Steinernema glaseri TaxID=37863 RepID=A0A1I7Y1M2_9BILA
MDVDHGNDKEHEAITRLFPEICSHFPQLDMETLSVRWLQFKNALPAQYDMAKKFLDKAQKKKRTEFLQRYELMKASVSDPLRVLLFLLDIKIFLEQRKEDSTDSNTSTPPVMPQTPNQNKSILRAHKGNGDAFIDARSDPVLQLLFMLLNRKDLLSPLMRPIATSTPQPKSVQFNFEHIKYHSPAPSLASNGTTEGEGYKPIEMDDVIRQVLDAFNGHMGDLFRYSARGYLVEPTQITKRALFEYQPNSRMQLKVILQLAGLAKQLSERVRGDFGTDVMARAFYFAVDSCCIAPFKQKVAQLYEKFRTDPKSLRLCHLNFFAADWGPRLQVVVDWINAATEQINVTADRSRTVRCGMQLLIEVIGPVLCSPSISWAHERAEEIAQRMYGCFHDLVKNWLLYGELNEFNEEFMLYCDCTVSDDQAWNRRFKTADSLVPGLLKQYPLLTEKILSIGKAMWFLKLSNNQHLYTARWEEHRQLVDQIQPHYYYTSSDLHVLANILERLEEMGNGVLLKDLREKYHFADHIRAMRTHFMLTDVDFATRLYEELRNVCSKPNFGLHDASRALKLAIDRSKSWATFPFEKCLFLSTKQTMSHDFCDVTLADIRLNFLYSPAAETPIIRVILWNSLERYMFTFRFVWNIFATRHTSMNLALEHMRLCKELRRENVKQEFSVGRTKLTSLLNKFSLGFFIMNQFTARLTFYVNQVVTKHSTEFTEALSEATSLDGVIQLHRLYIKAIYSDLCLEGSAVYRMILSIISCISRFCKMYTLFSSQFHMEREKRDMCFSNVQDKSETVIFELEEEEARHDVSVGDLAQTFTAAMKEPYENFKTQLKNLAAMDHQLHEAHSHLIQLLVRSQNS